MTKEKTPSAKEAKKDQPIAKKKKSLRTHKYVFALNEEEEKALNRYVDKYKVRNRSRFIRETLMFTIIKKFEEDTPTLFD